MKCISAFVFVLACLQVPAFTQILLLQKKGKTMKKFFAGQPIFYQVEAGISFGRIVVIENNQIKVMQHNIQEKKTAWGTLQSDTIAQGITNITLTDLKGVYYNKVDPSPTVNFTEKDYDPGELNNLNAPKNQNYFNTTWNTGEVGYLFSNALNEFLENNNRRKMKGMRRLGKKYRLVLI